MVSPFIRSFEATYFRWPHPVVKRPAGPLTIERLAEDRIILGDPASCLEQIQRFRTALGLTHLIGRISAPASGARPPGPRGISSRARSCPRSRDRCAARAITSLSR